MAQKQDIFVDFCKNVFLKVQDEGEIFTEHITILTLISASCCFEVSTFISCQLLLAQSKSFC